MRIQHNIAALNSYRNLTNNNSAVAKNLEKLSSGYRINRAGDDAAGLAISEKMRAQITGLNTAQKNAQDGISLVQTAEGALTEVHSMLNRMVELANQSANGTYADAPDRENLQAEIKSLKEEIDRISQATNFNGINLLDGSLGLNTKTFDIGETTAAVGTKNVSGADIGVVKTHGGVSTAEVKPEFTIDFADLAVGLNPNDSGAAVDSQIKLTSGGTELKVYSDTAGTAADPKWQVADGTTAATSKTAADIATELNGKYVVIEGSMFKMASTAGVSGNSAIKFTYEGIAKANGTIETTDVTEDTWKPVGDFEVSVSNSEVTAGRTNCHLTNITDPVVETKGERSGASLKITQDIIDRGSLTIGDKTFTFVDKAAGDASLGATEIGIKGLSGTALIESVTSQLSGKGTIKITKDNADYTFTLGARKGATDTIEIEENPAAAGKSLGNFTETELQAAFSQTQSAKNATSNVTLKDIPKAGDAIKIGEKTYTFSNEEGDGKVKIGSTAAESAKNLADALVKDKVNAVADGAKVTITAAQATDDAVKAIAIGSPGLVLQIGDTSASFNQMKVGVRDMSAKALGIGDIDISTQAGAQEAVDKIKAAINDVSSQRGDLGAIQNRLEHTINNLSVTAENMTAAESRIRDVDMAEEMMAYTKNNILVQAAQAMLAQANQVPQGVLQLLQ